MKTIALKDHPRFRMYRALRKAVEREIEPIIFDSYGGRGSLNDAVDAYFKYHLKDIAEDMAALLREDRAQREGRRS
jgi:hypothetical protein